MRTLRLFIMLVISLIGFTSCEKNAIEETDGANVERFIGLLKSNSFDSLYLPAFSVNDIPALLEYRNETQVISDFPTNFISSFYLNECALGVYVLWTIESVRAKAIDSKYLFVGFPSQNPVLSLRSATELRMVFDRNAHEAVARAYYNWWQNNRSKGVRRLMEIDPLANTAYQWH
ncbi:MAG: hypothetical protein A2X18_03775 [Bacteroidetes bacterium GWF2_40_14]|nr:MAG: hypothetical protein A2X18_03775 [Bacteroidetes bacterium GWF2_40_14]